MKLEDLYRILRTDHVQAQGMVDTIRDPMLVLDERLRIQSANRAFYETFKVSRDETIGRLIYDIGNRQWDIPELNSLLLDIIPKAAAIINYEVEHEFPHLGSRRMLLTARTLYHPDSASHSMLLSIEDATDRLRRQATKDILFNEMRHRVKNLLGVVQSVAKHTTTAGRSAEAYRDAFLGRFRALIDAQELAFTDEGKPSGLKEVVERVLSPYMNNPNALALGATPPIELNSRLVLSLSLALHELTTNAAKYGALSTPDGQVQLSWTLDETKNELTIIWQESGGPPVSTPKSSGYGTQLIQSNLTFNVGGRVKQEYAASGLRTEIVIPLEAPTPATESKM